MSEWEGLWEGLCSPFWCFFQEQPLPGCQPPSAGPLVRGAGDGGPGRGALGQLEMAAPWRGGVKWIFQTPRPSPTLHLLIQSPPLSQSRPGSAKCDLAPLIAGGAAVLARRRQRRPPSPGAQQPAGVADEGGKGPTLPNTHTYTRTHAHTMVGASGASWPSCWSLGMVLDPEPTLCWCPHRPQCRHRHHHADFPPWGLLSQ